MTKKVVAKLPEPTPTFDLILPVVQNWLQVHGGALNDILSKEDDWLLVNRDLNGRVRLILLERFNQSESRRQWDLLASALMKCLGKHAYPKSA